MLLLPGWDSLPISGFQLASPLGPEPKCSNMAAASDKGDILSFVFALCVIFQCLECGWGRGRSVVSRGSPWRLQQCGSVWSCEHLWILDPQGPLAHSIYAKRSTVLIKHLLWVMVSARFWGRNGKQVRTPSSWWLQTGVEESIKYQGHRVFVHKAICLWNITFLLFLFISDTQPSSHWIANIQSWSFFVV